jgi:hypothetical protein
MVSDDVYQRDIHRIDKAVAKNTAVLVEHRLLIDEQNKAFQLHQADEREWRDNMLESHERLLQSHDHIINSQAENTLATNKLAESLDNSIKSTKDLIDAWVAAQGAIKVGRAAGSFVKWLSSFAVIGFILVWLNEVGASILEWLKSSK